MLEAHYKAWWMGEAQNAHGAHSAPTQSTDVDGDGNGDEDEDDDIRYLPSNLAVQALDMALQKGLASSGAYTRHLVAALDLVSG